MLAPGILLQSRYQIVRLIGQGGVGAVYQASDRRLGHTVAIKQILHSDMMLDAAFEREAQLLARLRHPALPKVTDHFVEAAGHFLVMEFIPGDDLATLVMQHREPLSVDNVLRWADQLLAVLTYLHSQEPPVVHRDIKPQNLKLNERGELILLDFGLAKGMPGQASTDRSVAGYTLHYAPPEQLRGEQTDARSDLYALAATLYDLLSAVKPSDALKRLATINAGRPDPLAPLHVLNPAVPIALGDVISRALAPAPAARFASAAAMRSALYAARGDTTEIVGQIERVRPSTPASNLPVQLTSFVGREDEIVTLQRLLQRSERRLVTLTGPGGIGKTRLALSVASHCLAHFADGVFFVSLAPIGEPQLVLFAIAQTLGLREPSQTMVLQNLQTSLLDKETLLVLDNFEHVVSAAPLVRDLLAACPHLKVLVTSREALQVQGEQEFPVPVLGLPAVKQVLLAEDLGQFPAIELFVQRAQSVKPGFALRDTSAAAVVEICKRLDGLPLAIELAAAQIKFFSPAAILSRLAERFDLLSSGSRDMPDRQRTLRASIGWSYDLLDGDEKALFRRLSLFSGSFDLEAAEVLCQHMGKLRIPVLVGITSLVDKSLLKPVEPMELEPRFTMLETIREYGLRELRAAGEGRAGRDAHAGYYHQLAQEAERHIWGADIATWVKRLEMENDNLRAALNYTLGHEGGAERSLQLAGSLWRFWEIRGHIVEGRTWLARALERRADAPPSSRWLSLHGAGNLAVDQGEYEIAKGYYLESLHLLQEQSQVSADGENQSKAQRGIANTLTNLGNIALFQGECQQALVFTEEALAIHRRLDRKVGMAITINNLAKIKLCQGDYTAAAALSTESLALYRELGDERGIGWNLERLGTIARERGHYQEALSLYSECRLLFEKLSNQVDMAPLLLNLGELARQQGAYEEAEAHFQAGLTLAQELDNKKEIANLLSRLGVLACHRRHYAEATRCTERSISLQRAIGNLFGVSEALYCQGQLAYVQENYGAARRAMRESLRLRAQLGDRRGMVDSLQALAALAVTDLWLPQRAAALLSAAEQLRSSMAVVIPPVDRDGYEDLIDTLRAALGEAAFAEAWADGQAMDAAQLVYVLEEE